MKKIISYLFCFIMMLTFASCGNDAYIGMDKAKDTVVSDIGAIVDDVEFAANELVNDDNGDYYYMKFKKDGKLYTYKVDAVSGDIIEKNSDDDYDDNNNNNNDNNNNNTTDNTQASNQNAENDSILESDTTENTTQSDTTSTTK